MHVKHFLSGDFPVRQEEVDALGTVLRGSDCVGDTLRHPKKLSSHLGIEIGENGRMLNWSYQNMTRVNWLDVHEGDHLPISMDLTERRQTLNQIAEHTLHRSNSAAPVWALIRTEQR